MRGKEIRGLTALTAPGSLDSIMFPHLRELYSVDRKVASGQSDKVHNDPKEYLSFRIRGIRLPCDGEISA